MKKPAPIRINLLPKDPFLATPVGRFLQWALHAGRYLVIFTEMVVITSFGSRFVLDRQVTDLNVALRDKQMIIGSYGDLEDRVRSVQKKLSSYKQIDQQQELVSAFPALTEVTPADVSLDKLTIQPGLVLFSGKTLSQNSLNLLINNLQLSQRFSDVVVKRIETGTARDPGVQFEIEAKVKPVQANSAPAAAPILDGGIE